MGQKTREQRQRILQRKDDVPYRRQMETALSRSDQTHSPQPENPAARQSEFQVSRGGLNQESHHNKHNRGGQEGHEPQQHTRAEEKR